jgi:hypothetical protein
MVYMKDLNIDRIRVCWYREHRGADYLLAQKERSILLNMALTLGAKSAISIKI